MAFLFPCVMLVSFLAGIMFAILWEKFESKRELDRRQYESLIAEFMEKHLWQFISLEEWLEKSKLLKKG